MKVQLLIAACALLTTACGATPRAHDQPTSPPEETVLVATGGPFEIHIRDGRVLQLVPARGGQPPVIREIRRLDDLRTLYETASGEPLPAPDPNGGVTLNGWIGLECVRAGHACGPAPDAMPRALVVVHLE